MAKRGTLILDGAYEVLYVKPGVIGFGKSFVDLRKLTPEKAEQLVKAGCPYLRKVDKKTTRSKDEKKVDS